jgi:phenylpyruvate tautomerase PptA (4-oxalocrotonate tautomerase family)
MPFVSIKYVKENIADDPEGKMTRIADKVSKAIADEMGVGPDSVWVGFEPLPAAEFYVGAASVAARRAKKA